MSYQQFEQRWRELEKRKPSQIEIVKEMLQGLSDSEIAEKKNLTPETVRKHISTTCKDFKDFGIKKRSELLSLLGKYKPALVQGNRTLTQVQHITLSTGVVPLDSPLYLERDVDEKCRQYLQAAESKEGSLPFIRIRASKGMGKSSLLVRLCHFLERERKQAVGYVDLGSNDFDQSAFKDLNLLLRQFTYAIAQKFRDKLNNHTPLDVKDYWREDIASGSNCTNYLKEHIFSKIEQPKTLLIDGIDAVLGQKETQNPFLNLLRTWNESQMKLVSDAPIVWPSMVIAYSTEPYPEYGIKSSPLQNVGVEIDLNEFSPDETQELAKRYGLDWNPNEVSLLRQLIGGHPALINRALFEISQKRMDLSELEMSATLIPGPFEGDLLKKLDILKGNEDLKECFNKILFGESCADEFAKFQLAKAGLIMISKGKIEIGNKLYKKYFKLHL